MALSLFRYAGLIKFDLFIIILISSVKVVSGQESASLRSKDENNRLLFGLENVSFFKNNEYKGIDGYTLTGAWIRPSLIFSFSGKLEFEAGWHYLRYNGASKESVSVPWLSSNLKLSRTWRMIIGNLEYYDNHQLIRPMWEPERFLTEKPEAGLQFLHHTERTFFDAWVNWEQFIQKGDPFQEYFTVGGSLNRNIYTHNNLKINYPLQILFFHKGGEIDATTLHVQTYMNLAAGLTTSFEMQGFVKKFSCSAFYLLFRDIRKNMALPESIGTGLFISAEIRSKSGAFQTNYWKGNDFYAEKGMKLFQSFYDNNNNQWISSQSMLEFNYSFEKEIVRGVVGGSRAEGWFDLSTGKFSNVAFIYVRINQQYLLRKI